MTDQISGGLIEAGDELIASLQEAIIEAHTGAVQFRNHLGGRLVEMGRQFIAGHAELLQIITRYKMQTAGHKPIGLFDARGGVDASTFDIFGGDIGCLAHDVFEIAAQALQHTGMFNRCRTHLIADRFIHALQLGERVTGGRLDLEADGFTNRAEGLQKFIGGLLGIGVGTTGQTLNRLRHFGVGTNQAVRALLEHLHKIAFHALYFRTKFAGFIAEVRSGEAERLDIFLQLAGEAPEVTHQHGGEAFKLGGVSANLRTCFSRALRNVFNSASKFGGGALQAIFKTTKSGKRQVDDLAQVLRIGF